MCPFRAGYKISATRGKLHAVLRRSRPPRPPNSSERSERNPKLWRSHISHAVFHMLRISVPSACLGKNLRSKVFHCAKLRDGTRDSALALKNLPGSPPHADLRRSRPPRPPNSSERSERNPKLWRSHTFTCFASLSVDSVKNLTCGALN